MTMVDIADSRFAKAVELAAGAGQWAKVRSKDGERKAYGIPSSKGDGRYYLVTGTSCDCFDARQHQCKHQLAVAIHCALVKAQQPKPKAKRSAKLAAAPAPADRGVVLSMVRHGDRDVTWEAHSHTAALASRYDSIHGGEAF
jgi:hypothetical protein